MKQNISVLCQEYKKVVNGTLEITESINGSNFENKAKKVFDREDYLAEIYYYLFRRCSYWDNGYKCS
ncbi:hypothetical protein OIA_05141 [Enterococcus faecium EnGen0018]|nr:hypothetical protein OIA_05141 [Enterococcus faecium EnGen0018]